VIDLHAHILPGVDDGPASIEEAVELARAAVDAGTRVLAATSHVSHMFPTDPHVFPARLAEVRDALRDAGVGLEVVPGGELAPSRVAELEPLVHELQQRDWRILLAHPERSAAFHREPERLVRLVDGGALVQVTAGSLTGQFGQTARRFSVSALRDGLVHVLASDAHDAYDRPPGLAAGLAAAEHDLPGIGAQAEWLTDEIPAAILAGHELPPRPALPRRHRGLRGRMIRRA